MKKIALLLVTVLLLSSTYACADGCCQGKGWGEPAPNSGDGIPDGPGR